MISGSGDSIVPLVVPRALSARFVAALSSEYDWIPTASL